MPRPEPREDFPLMSFATISSVFSPDFTSKHFDKSISKERLVFAFSKVTECSVPLILYFTLCNSSSSVTVT